MAYGRKTMAYNIPKNIEKSILFGVYTQQIIILIMYIRVHRSTSMEHLILTVLKMAEKLRVDLAEK